MNTSSSDCATAVLRMACEAGGRNAAGSASIRRRPERDARRDERAERHDEHDVRDSLAVIEVAAVPREAAHAPPSSQSCAHGTRSSAATS